jgi:hypothetical protein
MTHLPPQCDLQVALLDQMTHLREQRDTAKLASLPRGHRMAAMRALPRTSLTIALLLGISSLAGCAASGLPEPGPLPAGKGFAGVWDSNWGQMELQHAGGRVHGTFRGFRTGSVSGEQRGDLFVFKWTQVGSAQWGRGFLRMSPDGQRLEGKWGYLKDYANGGRWWASRGQQ